MYIEANDANSIRINARSSNYVRSTVHNYLTKMTSNYDPIRRLPNMQDAGPSELAQRDNAITKLRSVFGLRGYDRAETPILEQTELYLRKSGGTLSSRLYGFTEPGGYEVSLRPEFTAAILRKIINNMTGNSAVRIMYDGPVFRYAGPEDEDGVKTRQFTQLGAELIGPPAPDADGEIIAMSLEGLNALEIADTRVVVGHVGAISKALAAFDLSERAKLFLINNISELKKGEANSVLEKAETLGFIAETAVGEAQASSDRAQIAQKIERVLSNGIVGPFGQNIGPRTVDDIVERLSKKLSQADDPDNFKKALQMLSAITQVNGTAEKALETAEKVLSDSGVDSAIISSCADVVSSAQVEGVQIEQINIDFGLARGITYYTGMIFDIYSNDNNSESHQTLGGGGRYDGLTRALGYDCDFPSLGFAYNLDAVVACQRFSSNSGDKTYFVSSENCGSVQSAVKEARELRATGKRAAVEYKDYDTPSSSVQAKGEGR